MLYNNLKKNIIENKRKILYVRSKLYKYTQNGGETKLEDKIKGNIEKLLAGSEGTIFIVTLKGDTESAYNYVSSQSWVSSIDVQKKDDKIKWQVKVTDDNLAEEKLLRLILENEKVKVTDYRLKQYELEEIFLQVVEDLREETIEELHKATNENIQQISGRIITYDQILQMCDWKNLKVRYSERLA